MEMTKRLSKEIPLEIAHTQEITGLKMMNSSVALLEFRVFTDNKVNAVKTGIDKLESMSDMAMLTINRFVVVLILLVTFLYTTAMSKELPKIQTGKTKTSSGMNIGMDSAEKGKLSVSSNKFPGPLEFISPFLQFSSTTP